MRVFAVMEEFVMGREHNITQERQELLDTIINSNFFEEYFRRQLAICRLCAPIIRNLKNTLFNKENNIHVK